MLSSDPNSQTQSWRLLLRPGWILGAIAVACFSIACFTVLSPWQLGKGAAADQRNEQLAASYRTAPVPLEQLQPVGVSLHQENIWREVSITGHYLGSTQIALKLRSADPSKATEILTLFKEIGSSRVVLVNRGFVANQGKGTPGLIPSAPGGLVTVLGWILVPESTSPYKEPKVEDGQRTAYAIDVSRLTGDFGLPNDTVVDYYLQLAPGQPGSLGTIARPESYAGPYRSYGFQWIVLGLAVPVLFVVLVRRRLKLG